MNYLVDSSVFLTALVDPDREYAAKITNYLDEIKTTKFALTLTKIEVSNGLIYSVKNNEAIEAQYRNFLSFNITFIDIDEITLTYARFIALQVKDTVYDSLYHAYAILNSMTFLTLDKKYFNKANYLGSIELID